MDKWDEIMTCAMEMKMVSPGAKKEKLAGEILVLYKKIMQEINSGSDDYDDRTGEVHCCAMQAFYELGKFEESFEEGKKALLYEDTFDQIYTLGILKELIGIAIKLFKKSNNRVNLNEAKMYGKKLLEIDPNNNFKKHIIDILSI